MEKGSKHVQFLVALSTTLVYLTAGTFLGWVSPVLPHLSSVDTLQPLKEDQISWVVSLMHVGHVLLAVPAGYMMDWVGRKWALTFTAVPFLVSWLLMALAEDSSLELNGEKQWYVRVELLYAARLSAGLGVGVGSTVAAVYLAEISQDSIRGAIGTLFQVMVNLGVMFEYSVAPYVSYGTLTMISAIFPIIFLVSFTFAPESPYYLLMHNQRMEAQQVLLSLRGLKDPGQVEAELNLMEKTVEDSRKNVGTLRDLLTSKRNLRPLMVCFGLFSTTALSGHIAILSYSTEMFQESRSSLDPSISVIVLGGVQTLLSLIPSLLVDIAGRRPLLLVSSAGCAASLAIEGFYFYFLDYGLSGLDWVPLSGFILFLIFFTLGLGPVPVAIMAEIFPTNVKGIASSLLSIYVAVMHFVITKVVLVVETELYVIFWTFSACCLAGMFFVVHYVPETRGKSFLKINLDMESHTDEITETKALIKSGFLTSSNKLTHR